MVIYQRRFWIYFELCREIRYLSIRGRNRPSIGVRIGKVWFSSKESIAFGTRVRIDWHGGMEPGWQHRFGGPS